MAGAVDDIVVNTGENQVVKYAMIGGMILVFGAIAYFGIVSPILEELGIKESDTDREANSRYQKAKQSGFWSTTYFNRVPSAIAKLNATNASQIAENIYGSFHFYNDDENNVISQFNYIENNAQLSYVCSHFNNKHQADLLDFLKEKLSSEEFLLIMDKTEKLK